MDDILGPVLAQLRATWSRRWAGLLVAWIVAAVAAVVVWRVPERWEADARVYVDTQTVLRPLLSGLAVQPDVDQMVSILARTLITRPNLEKLVGMAKLLPPGANQQTFDRMIEKLQAEIQISAAGDRDLYVIRYRDTDPQRAKRVVQSLVELFISSTAGGKRRDSEQARAFIDEQIAEYEKKLEDAENRVKEFKLKNFGYSGIAVKDRYAQLSLLSDELTKSRMDLHAAQDARDAIQRQLSGEDPVLLTEVAPTPGFGGTSEWDARLDALHKQLDDLTRRYTDNYPDVVETKRLIARIEAEKKAAQSKRLAQLGVSASHISPPATNPVYQQLQVALSEADANVAALQSRTNDLEAQLNGLRATAAHVPEVEAEMAKLNRDYDVIRHNYDALVQRREQAAISEDVDANAQMAVFRVIDPPHVLRKPVFPGHIALAALAVLASLGAGVAVAFGLTQVFPRVESAADLRQLSGGLPLLGTISMLVDARRQRRERFGALAFGGGLGGLLFVSGVWIVWMALHPAVV